MGRSGVKACQRCGHERDGRRYRWCADCAEIVRVEQERKRQRAYYVANRDRILAKAREYIAARKDLFRLRWREQYERKKARAA